MVIDDGQPFAAVDDAERQLALDRTRPGLAAIADATWSVGLDTTSNLVPTSFAYLFLDAEGGLHVLDAGTDSESNWQALTAAITQVAGGLGRVRSITATHLHPDHLGMADRLRIATGAPVAIHRFEQEAFDQEPAFLDDAVLDAWSVPQDRRDELRSLPRTRGRYADFTADAVLYDGDLLAVPGRSLRVIASPGHTRGHVCVRDEDRGVLFTGDHLLPLVNPGVGLGGAGPTNPLADYLASLRRVSAFDGDIAAPGHGYRFRGIRRRAATIADHHLARNAEIVALRRAHPDDTVWQIASQVSWSAGWPALKANLLASALAQVVMHLELGGTA